MSRYIGLKFKCPTCNRQISAARAKLHFKMAHALEYSRDGYTTILTRFGHIKDEYLVADTPQASTGPVMCHTQKEKIIMPATPETLNVKEESKAKEKRYKHVECGAEFDDFKDENLCPDCGAKLRDKEVN